MLLHQLWHSHSLPSQMLHLLAESRPDIDNVLPKAHLSRAGMFVHVRDHLQEAVHVLTWGGELPELVASWEDFVLDLVMREGTFGRFLELAFCVALQTDDFVLDAKHVSWWSWSTGSID